MFFSAIFFPIRGDYTGFKEKLVTSCELPVDVYI